LTECKLRAGRLPSKLMDLHGRAAETYLRAARVHDDAAEFWGARGYPDAAARERAKASELRSAALVEKGLGEAAAGRRPPLAILRSERHG